GGSGPGGPGGAWGGGIRAWAVLRDSPHGGDLAAAHRLLGDRDPRLSRDGRDDRGVASKPDPSCRRQVTGPRPKHHNLVTNSRAAARNRSFSSRSPIVTRTPSPAKHRVTTRWSRQWASKSDAASASGSQTKLAWVSGTAWPMSSSASRTRERSATTA